MWFLGVTDAANENEIIRLRLTDHHRPKDGRLPCPTDRYYRN